MVVCRVRVEVEFERTLLAVPWGLAVGVVRGSRAGGGG